MELNLRGMDQNILSDIHAELYNKIFISTKQFSM